MSTHESRFGVLRTVHFWSLSALLVAFSIFPEGAQCQTTGSQSVLIVGSIVGGNTSPLPFSVTVNGFTKTVNYCECTQPGVSGFLDSPSTLASALASAFTSDSSSPVNASANNGLLTLTSKTAGTVLTVTSSDGGAGLGGLGGISFLGIPVVPTQSMTNPVPGFVNPKFVVVGITYAPPGASSSADYTNSKLLGSTVDIEHSFKNQVTLTVTVKNSVGINADSAGKGGVIITGQSSTSHTQGSSDGKTVTIEKTTTQSNTTPGPADSFVGLDHDFDLVWLWLNPVNLLTIDADNPNTVSWDGFGFDPADQPDLDVFPVPVGMLNGDIPVSPGVASVLARAWAQTGQIFPAGQGPGLTGPGPGTDFDIIVRMDPFWECTRTPANCPTSVDLTRYALSNSQNLVYEQAPVGGQPVTQTFQLNYSNSTVQSTGTTTEFSQEFSLEENFGGTLFGIGVETTLTQADTMTWTTDTKNSFTDTATSTALATITGPTCTVPAGQNFCSPEYTGPAEFLVYQDHKFGSFMFFPTKDPRFRLAATPASQGVPVGGTVTYTVSSTPLDGFTGDVSLSVTGVPQGQGITASFNPATIAGGSGSSTFTVDTSSSTPAATSNLIITGTSGTVVEHVPIVLEVQDFTIQVTPNSQTVTAGGNTSYQVTITPVDNMNLSTLALSVSGLPAGATGTFSTPTANGSGGLSSTLTIATTASVAAGNNSLTVCGVVSGLTRCAVPVNLVVVGPDFSISATPSSQSVIPGECATYTINVAPSNGFTGTVSLSASGMPSGATSMFNPPTITGSGSSMLTICTTTSTPAGSYTIIVTGISGNLNHSTPLDLTVQDFTVSATPSSQTVQAGAGTSYMVSTTALNGFSRTVTLSLSGLPSGASSSFNPASITGAGSSTLTVTTSSTTPPGTYTLTITGGTPINGTGSTLSRSTMVTLVVTGPDFTIAASPPSVTITRRGTANYTTTIGAVNGFTGKVTLSITGTPTNTTATFTPTSVTGSGTSTLKITSKNSTPTGTFTLTITGASGALSHSTKVTLIVQ